MEIAPGRVVSPELMLRPSLSVTIGPPVHRVAEPRVAGAYAPAFVERIRGRPLTRGIIQRVAGAYAPAFVERAFKSFLAQLPAAGVAGAYAPAFVERPPNRRTARSAAAKVSPELMLRPSLSGAHFANRRKHRPVVSPELMLRPSLSRLPPPRGRVRGPARARGKADHQPDDLAGRRVLPGLFVRVPDVC